jgi:hypothetical protein
MKVYWIDSWNNNNTPTLRSANCKKVTLKEARNRMGWVSGSEWYKTTEPTPYFIGTYFAMNRGKFFSTKKKAITSRSANIKSEMNECLDDLSGLKKELDLLETLK